MTSKQWVGDAETAIKECEKWATEVGDATHCRLYLFGSAIYSRGEQFDGQRSDLDIVCSFQEASDALQRFNTVLQLREFKAKLELQLLPALKRESCTEPAVSLVPASSLEIRANVHKSGARRFFDKNFYYDLLQHAETLGIPSAGTCIIGDEHRQAMEYVQHVRNLYLAVCANGSGGLIEYTGTDPMPKPLLRAAAQLNLNAAEGTWYDTRLGLEFMHAVLRDRAEDNDTFARLTTAPPAVGRTRRG